MTAPADVGENEGEGCVSLQKKEGEEAMGGGQITPWKGEEIKPIPEVPA